MCVWRCGGGCRWCCGGVALGVCSSAPSAGPPPQIYAPPPLSAHVPSRIAGVLLLETEADGRQAAGTGYDLMTPAAADSVGHVLTAQAEPRQVYPTAALS